MAQIAQMSETGQPRPQAAGNDRAHLKNESLVAFMSLSFLGWALSFTRAGFACALASLSVLSVSSVVAFIRTIFGYHICG